MLVRRVVLWFLLLTLSGSASLVAVSEMPAQQAPSGISWQGRTSWLVGHTTQSADGDSLDLRGATAGVRAGTRITLPMPWVSPRFLVEPMVGLTLNTVAGIQEQGRGVATSSTDLMVGVGLVGQRWSLTGLLGNGTRSTEYRATGLITNPTGGQSLKGARLELQSKSSGAFTIEWIASSAELRKAEDGGDVRDISSTSVKGQTLLVGWSGAFRGGFDGLSDRTWKGLPPVFAFVVENDAFVDSDTGYTNGVRAVWSGWHGDVGAALARVALLGWRPRTKHFCPLVPMTSDYKGGACLIVYTALGQTMYTPSTLNADSPQFDDRPFAGHLFASVRTQRVDQHRYKRGQQFALLTASSEVTMGVKGPWSGARHTQALAHWTWSHAAVRPTGWSDQLKNEFMGGVTIEGAARPNGWEHCRRREGCSGESNENRLWDLTPRGELVLGSSMVRSSAGAVMRLGRNMPSAVALDRIPAILNQFVPSERSERPKAPKWGLLFATVDLRAVAHNAFLEGASPMAISGDGAAIVKSSFGPSSGKSVAGRRPASGTGMWRYISFIVRRSTA